jgi:tetratricopeptide (TPR) repeat protein
MAKSKKGEGFPKAAGGLLGILVKFEKAGESILPRQTREQRTESLERLRVATEQLREYLALHLAPKEMAEWRELPDSDTEITAFGYELKMEHADLYRELGDLLGAIDDYEKALDLEEAATRIKSACKTLAMRLARHAAGEQAELGRYTA